MASESSQLRIHVDHFDARNAKHADMVSMQIERDNWRTLSFQQFDRAEAAIKFAAEETKRANDWRGIAITMWFFAFLLIGILVAYQL